MYLLIEERKQYQMSLSKRSKYVKRLHKKDDRGLSLKSFVHLLEKSGDPEAAFWFSGKAGDFNEKRSDKNIKAASEARFASKSARKKSKGSSISSA
jgi:hypothetical protein